jgi:hypothetical protein
MLHCGERLGLRKYASSTGQSKQKAVTFVKLNLHLNLSDNMSVYCFIPYHVSNPYRSSKFQANVTQ